MALHKEKTAQKAIMDHVDRVFASKKINFLTDSELAAAAMTLGQLGDRLAVEQVKQVCQRLATRYAKHPDSLDHHNLFHAYKGLARMARK